MKARYQTMDDQILCPKKTLKLESCIDSILKGTLKKSSYNDILRHGLENYDAYRASSKIVNTKNYF